MQLTTTAALNRFGPLSILRMLWKGKVIILISWVLVTAGVYVYVRKLPATYTAEATVVVDSQKIPDRYVSSTVNTDLQDRLASISQQILSVSRLQKIMDDFGLYRDERRRLAPEDVVEKMRSAITIQAETKAFSSTHVGAFKVGFQGADPTVVAGVANRISTLYVEENLRTREVEAAGTEEFIENQLQDAKKTLDNLEAAVSKYKLEHNGELPQQQAELSATLARLQVALEANRDAINRAQQTKVTLGNSLDMAEANLSALMASVEAAQASGGAAVVSGGLVSNVPAQRPKRPSETIAEQIEALSTRYEPTHPEMKRLQAQLAAAKTLEEKEDKAAAKDAGAASAAAKDGPAPPAPAAPRAPEKSVGPSRGERLASISNNLQIAQAHDRVAGIKTQIQFADKEIADRQAEQDRILKETGTYQAKLQRLPVREQEMAQITRDYEIAKANYKSLLDKKLSAGMATAMERREKSERFEVIDPAQVPSNPTKPNRPMLDAGGSIAGLIFGLLIALGLELKRDTVLGAWEMPARVPVLGKVPHIDVCLDSADGIPRFKARKLRLAILCSIAFSVLIALAAGAYVMTRRF